MTRSRRDFLRFGALAAGGLALACLPGSDEDSTPVPTASTPRPTATPTAERSPTPAPTAPPTPMPTPRPVPSAGRIERLLLEDTQWATPAVITHSGVEGPRVMILGGVHGNEPGGWLAAEAIADWDVERGSLVVVPRANMIATEIFERTTEELGDLNRLYPGSTAEEALPMSHMAAQISALAREFEVERLLDLHESWAFFRERSQGRYGLPRTDDHHRRADRRLPGGRDDRRCDQRSDRFQTRTVHLPRRPQLHHSRHLRLRLQRLPFHDRLPRRHIALARQLCAGPVALPRRDGSAGPARGAARPAAPPRRPHRPRGVGAAPAPGLAALAAIDAPVAAACYRAAATPRPPGEDRGTPATPRLTGRTDVQRTRR